MNSTVLKSVLKPGRYSGGEYGQIVKDKKDVRIGTVRSARHDYLDYVLENDAIFVHFGWNAPAKLDAKTSPVP